jgi:hypothetical protein
MPNTRRKVLVLLVVAAGLVAWGLMGGHLEQLRELLGGGNGTPGRVDRPPIIVADGSVTMTVSTGQFVDDANGHVKDKDPKNKVPAKLTVTVNVQQPPWSSCKDGYAFDTMELDLFGGDGTYTDEYSLFIWKKDLTITTGKYDRSLANTTLEMAYDLSQPSPSWKLQRLSATDSNGAPVTCTFSATSLPIITVAQPSK